MSANESEPTPANEPTTYVVSARVVPAVYHWINAFERHLLAGTMGANKNRSAAIKACFGLTSAALTTERMEAIRVICTKRSDTVENVLADVLDSGIAAQQAKK